MGNAIGKYSVWNKERRATFPDAHHSQWESRLDGLVCARWRTHGAKQGTGWVAE